MSEHISRHFEEQLDLVKQKILRMAAMVEEAVERSVRAVLQRDARLARQVIDGDPYVDELEIEIDNASLELLALRQPMARDLRFIATALKIVKDLERVGDLAVDMAERTETLDRDLDPEVLPTYREMAESARKMLRDSLDAFVHRDPVLARKVLEADDVVDRLHEQLTTDLVARMVQDPGSIARASNLMFVAKYLERVGDHSSNIAEMVIFMVEGLDVRHQGKIARARELQKAADPEP